MRVGAFYFPTDYGIETASLPAPSRQLEELDLAQKHQRTGQVCDKATAYGAIAAAEAIARDLKAKLP